GSTDQLEQYRAQHPNSPHLGELETTLDKLYWDKAMGAGSTVAFEEYLAKSPNGKHRDEAQENLTWRKTESTNTIQAFRDYQRKHLSQAQDAIEKLTEAAKPAKPPTPTVNTKAEVIKLVERYVKAYNDTNIEELRQIWPGMDKREVSNMHDFFRTARNIKSSYT